MSQKEIIFHHSYNNNQICGYLNATFIQENPHQLRNGKVYYSHQYIVLNTLHVDEKVRSKGIGSILLNQLINYAKQKGVNKIILDDMSDNYKQTHNIYLKHGFKYLYEEGPEMQLVF